MHSNSIQIYPIKSLDGITVPEARMLAEGALENDREFSCCDHDGKVVRGKREPRLLLVRSSFKLTGRMAGIL